MTTSDTKKKHTELKPGDRVLYFPVLGKTKLPNGIPATVTDVYQNGIPSCREPMVKLDNKAGVVLASHCMPDRFEWSVKDA
jgi:hypothetical protein